MAKRPQPQPGTRGTIRDAVEDAAALRIQYRSKKAGDRVITRTVRPEEVRGGVLWATDTIHGRDHVHSFKLSRVLSARATGRTFIPYSDR